MESSQGVLSRAAQFLKTTPAELLERMEQQANEMKQLRQAVEKFKAEASLGEARQFLACRQDGGATSRFSPPPATAWTPPSCGQMGDFLRDKDPKVVAVIASVNGEKITFLAVCGKEAVARGIKAGDLVQARVRHLRRQGRRQAGFRHGRRQRSPEAGRCAGLRGRFRVREAGLRRKEHPMKNDCLFCKPLPVGRSPPTRSMRTSCAMPFMTSPPRRPPIFW